MNSVSETRSLACARLLIHVVRQVFLPAILTVSALLGSELSAAASSPEPVSLSGLQWRTSPGDDPEKRAPDYDDSAWPTVALPGGVGEILTGENGIVWFRVRIPSSEISRFARPAIFLGRIAEADEAYLDGQLIGSTGTIYRSALRYEGVGPAQLSRVYPVPADISSGETAVLALRVQSGQFAPGPSRGPLLLGELETLTVLARRSDIPIWFRDCLLLTLMFVGACLSFAGNARNGQSDRRSRWLPWFFGSLLIAILPSTLPSFESGLAKPGIAALAELAPFPVFGALHLASSVGTQVTRLQWILLTAIYLVWVPIVVGDMPYDVFIGLSWTLIAPLICGVASISLWQAFRAFGMRKRVSKWTYIAIAAVFVSIVVYAGLGKQIHPAFDPVAIGICIMALCLLMAQAEHATWDRAALQRVTGELLVAQDTERERLAKDLHDELSHRVAAIRLQLESLLYRPKAPEREDLHSPIEDLRETGMEISALVEGLRPATLDPLNFSDAVRQAVDRWSQIGDLRISLKVPDNVKLPGPKQIQLMRILQEALHNAVRHAEAEEISVRITLNERVGRLTVSDNGSGFDPGASESGLGLRTMRERAGLIGAEFNLSSTPGRGTAVEVEFKPS